MKDSLPARTDRCAAHPAVRVTRDSRVRRFAIILLLPAIIFSVGCEEEEFNETPTSPSVEEIQAAIEMTRQEYERIMESRLAAARAEKWATAGASSLVCLVVGLWINNKVRSDYAAQKGTTAHTMVPNPEVNDES